jgi:hypothetical protein
MSLLVGEQLGPCETVAPLSADGIDKVYRAPELCPEHKMAIKLSPQFSEWNPSHPCMMAAKPDSDVGAQK